MLWRKGLRRCARWGQSLDGPHQATLEHIVPKSAGGRTTRTNLTLSHAKCNGIAGQALWQMVRQRPTELARNKTSLSAAFWYGNLYLPAPSARVPSSRDPAFQLLSAIASPRPSRRAPASGKWNRASENENQALLGSMSDRFAICVDYGEYEGILERWKVYAVLPDPDAEAHGQYRVMDESGEDYLYPQDYFRLVELPDPIATLYRASHVRA
ncbi:MAG: HNH endonuclease [Gemmatimonadetes bacterium]|nr:HNH endonuclease [Gemmatimonadota bacterium]